MLITTIQEAIHYLKRAREEPMDEIKQEEIGTVISIGKNVARIRGLNDIMSHEVLLFGKNRAGIAFNLDREETAVIMLDESESLRAGDEVRRSGSVVRVPVGDELLGRVVDSLGRPIDDRGSVNAAEQRPIQRDAPAIIDRSPVKRPLQTGIMALDSLIPIGLGQRELILGDRQTGKSAITVDTIINQKDKDVICIYCAIGQRNSAIARVIDDFNNNGVMDRCIVVAASGDEPPGMIYAAPYAATAMAEFFMDRGDDVLVVYDDLTSHARAYREISLLLRRPPAREAYPGDIFYIHSRLLERATQFKESLGGGSLTALPVIEVQEGNISAYIPTNLISITDGQIYLSTRLFQEGIMPAIDVGKSVSRVGGKAQLPAYGNVSGDLRLAYSQFEELESFARFSTTLDENTRKKLVRGRRIRETLKQFQYHPLTAAEQVAILFAVKDGLFDGIALNGIREAKDVVKETMREHMAEIGEHITGGGELDDEMAERLRNKLKDALSELEQDEKSDE